MLPQLGGWEWVILAVVALLLFGGTRLAGIGKSAGKAIREFKEETAAIANPDEAPSDAPSADAPKPTRPDAPKPKRGDTPDVIDADSTDD